MNDRVRMRLSVEYCPGVLGGQLIVNQWFGTLDARKLGWTS
jgi:hypothetical protein